jgi:outer membrane protein OmpA-like peptidoglycan-associated protein
MKGNTEYNEKLSYMRGRALKNLLELKGIDSSRVVIVGSGECHPMFFNVDKVKGQDMEILHSHNRRTVITITKVEEY